MAKKKKTGSGVDASPRRNGRPRPIARRPHQVPRVSVAFPERGLTRGSFKDECDINRIVDQYARTGLVTHVAQGSPQYGDAPDLSLYEASCVQAEIRSADELGALQPAEEPSGDDLEQSEGEPTPPPQETSQGASDAQPQPADDESRG